MRTASWHLYIVKPSGRHFIPLQNTDYRRWFSRSNRDYPGPFWCSLELVAMISVFAMLFASKARRLITQSVVGTLTALAFGPATLCFSVHIVLVVGRWDESKRQTSKQLTIK
jgi:ABC-type polysaccharide/polyol phosphate export permease